MNILIYSLIIFTIIYFLLRFIVNVSSKKITKSVRVSILFISFILAIILAFGGRFLLSLPLVLLSLALVKLKGLSMFQLVALFRLIQTLRNSGRFSFNQKRNQGLKNSSEISLEEAYKILNLDKGRSKRSNTKKF